MLLAFEPSEFVLFDLNEFVRCFRVLLESLVPSLVLELGESASVGLLLGEFWLDWRSFCGWVLLLFSTRGVSVLLKKEKMDILIFL